MQTTLIRISLVFETMKGEAGLLLGETIAVAAGAIAQKALSGDNLQITTYVDRIHDIECPTINEIPTLEQIEASPTRCPHTESAEKMEKRILEAKESRRFSR